MTEIKRDFLYEFNRGLKNTYSNSHSILSVFENIENGAIKLAPIELPEEDFLGQVEKCIFIIKKILADPY